VGGIYIEINNKGVDLCNENTVEICCNGRMGTYQELESMLINGKNTTEIKQCIAMLINLRRNIVKFEEMLLSVLASEDD